MRLHLALWGRHCTDCLIPADVVGCSARGDAEQVWLYTEPAAQMGDTAHCRLAAEAAASRACRGPSRRSKGTRSRDGGDRRRAERDDGASCLDRCSGPSCCRRRRWWWWSRGRRRRAGSRIRAAATTRRSSSASSAGTATSSSASTTRRDSAINRTPQQRQKLKMIKKKQRRDSSGAALVAGERLMAAGDCMSCSLRLQKAHYKIGRGGRRPPRPPPHASASIVRLRRDGKNYDASGCVDHHLLHAWCLFKAEPRGWTAPCWRWRQRAQAGSTCRFAGKRRRSWGGSGGAQKLYLSGIHASVERAELARMSRAPPRRAR